MSERAVTLESDGFAFRYELDPTDENRFRWRFVSVTCPDGRKVEMPPPEKRNQHDARDVLYQVALTVLGLEGPQQPQGSAT